MMATIADLPHEILDIIFGESRLIFAIIFKRVSKYWRERMRIYPNLDAAEGLYELIDSNEIHLLSILFKLPEETILLISNNWSGISSFARESSKLGIIEVIRWTVKYCPHNIEYNVIDALQSDNTEILQIVIDQGAKQIRAAPVYLACHPEFKNFDDMMNILENQNNKSIKRVIDLVIDNKFDALRRLPEKAFNDLYVKFIDHPLTFIDLISIKIPIEDCKWLFAKISRYDTDGLVILISILYLRCDLISIVCSVYGIPLDKFSDTIIKMISWPEYSTHHNWIQHCINSAYASSLVVDSFLWSIKEDIAKIYESLNN